MKKTLGQIAYEARWGLWSHLRWQALHKEDQNAWEDSAKAVERAVLRRLKEGKKK